MEEHPWPPLGQPGYGPPPGDPASEESGRRFRLRDPLSMVLWRHGRFCLSPGDRSRRNPSTTALAMADATTPVTTSRSTTAVCFGRRADGLLQRWNDHRQP